MRQGKIDAVVSCGTFYFARILLSLIDRLSHAFIKRMSPEERERFMENTFEKFLAEMTPADRFRLFETLMPRFLEGIDQKELVSYVLKVLRKNLAEEMKNLSLREKVSLVANETGETISALLPSRIQRIITPTRHDKAE